MLDTHHGEKISFLIRTSGCIYLSTQNLCYLYGCNTDTTRCTMYENTLTLFESR